MSAKEGLNVDVSNLVLQDLDDKKVSLSTFKGNVLVMSGGGQAAIPDAQKWGVDLEKACASAGAKFTGFAPITNLPSFVPKNLVKDQMRKGGGPILIDWEGGPAKALGFSNPNVVNVWVIDKQGILRYQLVEKFSDEALSKVMEQVKKLL